MITLSQGFSSDIKELTKLIEDAINHDGFHSLMYFHHVLIKLTHTIGLKNI